MKLRNHHVNRALSVLFALLLSTQAFAQVESENQDDGDGLDLFDSDTEVTDKGWSQLTFSLGVMWLEADGAFSVGLPDGNKVTVLDLDRIGLDNDDTSYWLTANWRRNGSRWGFWFGTWAYDVAGYRVWEDELEIGDDVLVPVGAGVTTELSADWYIVEATYSLVRTRKVDMGVGFGLHAVDFDTTMRGAVQIGDEGREAIRESLDFLAPLPNIVGYLYWKPSSKWSLVTRYGWFGLTYDKYSGRMTNFHLLLRYNLNQRWGLEGGYQFVNLDLDAEEKFHTNIFDVDFNGPLAVLRYTF